MKNKKSLENKVVLQEWEESERDWGVRPDGISLHKDMPSYGRFVKKYWDFSKVNLTIQGPIENSSKEKQRFEKELERIFDVR